MGPIPCQLFGVHPADDLPLFIVWLPVGQQIKRPVERAICLAVIVRQKRFGEHPGRLDELWAVHEHEGMQGRVRGITLGHADDPLRHIEAFKHRGRAGPPPKGVEAAAIERFPLVGSGGLERLRHVIGLHRGSTPLVDEQSAGGQCAVANHLGRQPMPRSAGEPDIKRVVGHRLHVGDALLPVGLREHGRLDQELHVPTEAALRHRMGELPGQEVEQFRIFRPRRLAAEILGRLHEPDAEERLPEPVDRHPRQQRMVRIDEPAGEAQPVLRLVGREGGQHFRCVRLNRCATHAVFAPFEHIGHLRLRQFPHDHDLLRLLGKIIAGPPRVLEGFPLRGRNAVERGRDIVTKQLRRLPLGDRHLDRSRLERLPHLERRKQPIENAEVVDQAVLEAAVAHPLADPNLFAPAAGDLAGETVARHLRGRGMAVDKDLQACRHA